MKKKYSPEDFLTRAEKMRTIEFPTSDETRVIVLPNNEAIGFRFNCYKYDILGKYIDKSIFDATVKEANKICENVWREKKIQETEDFTAPLKYILYWAILLSLISFILLIVLVYAEGDDTLLYGAVILICIAGGTRCTSTCRADYAGGGEVAIGAASLHRAGSGNL